MVEEGLDVERWQIRVPKTGTQGELRGEEAYVFDVDALVGDQIERTLRRVNSSRRRGVPFVYRGTRQLAGESAQDDEEEKLLVAKSSEQDPEEKAQVLAIRELRELRKILTADCDARRRELDRLEAAVARRTLLLEEELTRIRNLVRAEETHAQELIRQCRLHYEEQLRGIRTTRSEIEAAATEDLKKIGEQITTVSTAREQVNKILHAPTAVDWFRGLKEQVVAVADSPMAEAAQLHLATLMGAAVSKRTKEPVSREDVLAAMCLAGKVARVRHEKLRELRHEDLCDGRRVDLALAGIEYFTGALEFTTLLDVLRIPSAVATA